MYAAPGMLLTTSKAVRCESTQASFAGPLATVVFGTGSPGAGATTQDLVYPGETFPAASVAFTSNE